MCCVLAATDVQSSSLTSLCLSGTFWVDLRFGLTLPLPSTATPRDPRDRDTDPSPRLPTLPTFLLKAFLDYTNYTREANELVAQARVVKQRWPAQAVAIYLDAELAEPFQIAVAAACVATFAATTTVPSKLPETVHCTSRGRRVSLPFPFITCYSTCYGCPFWPPLPWILAWLRHTGCSAFIWPLFLFFFSFCVRLVGLP